MENGVHIWAADSIMVRKTGDVLKNCGANWINEVKIGNLVQIWFNKGINEVTFGKWCTYLVF